MFLDVLLVSHSSLDELMHTLWGQLVPGDPFQMRKVLDNRDCYSEQNKDSTALTSSSPRVASVPQLSNSIPLAPGMAEMVTRWF